MCQLRFLIALAGIGRQVPIGIDIIALIEFSDALSQIKQRGFLLWVAGAVGLDLRRLAVGRSSLIQFGSVGRFRRRCHRTGISVNFVEVARGVSFVTAVDTTKEFLCSSEIVVLKCGDGLV